MKLNMNGIPKSFLKFIEQERIAWAVISFAPFTEQQVFGDSKVLESDDIVSQYFGDLSLLEQSLEGRILPRMVQQGRVGGVICKPEKNLIVGMLYNDDFEGVERYWHGKKLDEKLRALWAAAPE